MNSNNFFVQLIVRFLSKNPKFFKYIQVISIVLIAASAALNAIPTTSVPPVFVWLKSNVVWISGIVATIIAQLPNQTSK